jgi:1-deoxy-D-xylulose-5-phosphate synthase
VFDFSFLRHIPNMVVMAPRDEIELQRAMLTATLHDGPVAYRYPRGQAFGLPLPDAIEPFAVGRGEKLRDGNDAVIFALGTVCREALLAADMLAGEGLSVGVVDPRFLKPLDKELLVAEARRTGVVVTVEENVRQGGFGSAVLEMLGDEGIAARVLRIGLPDRFVEQGTQPQLHARYGLDAEGIAAGVRNFIHGQTTNPQSRASGA